MANEQQNSAINSQLGDAAQPEGDTRKRILLILLEENSCTASFISKQLHLSTVGVRRHLDNLVEESLVETVGVANGSGESKSRGRPAKCFKLTDKGRSFFGHDYDTLALSLLATLREYGGDEAVKQFAKKRVQTIVEGITPASVADASPRVTAQALVEAFSKHGYAATIVSAGNRLQICQHHCPISHVASEYPELCVAEHEALSELLGQHIQPLATIADGNGICTTNIPLAPIKRTPDERSGT